MPDPFSILNRHVKVSHETCERLKLYHDLLLKWQEKINLVSKDTLADAWQRHFLDSLQLLKYLPSLEMKIVDIGSGAGFPAMALAIAGAQQVELIESDAKKVSFLREVARITDTKVIIHHARCEDITNLKADIITSRACSELDRLLRYSKRFVSHETTCLFHKGKNYSTEISDAKKHWSFSHTIFPSVTDPQGVIVKLSNIDGGPHDTKYIGKSTN